LFIPKGMFLDFLISLKDVIADSAKIAAIYNRPMPIITIEVRGFVNTASYLYNLIKVYLKRISALTNYTNGPKS
jgi:hypothetical protein